MERFTKRDEYGNADIIGVSSTDLQSNLVFFEFHRVTKALNSLAHYEDLEEQGRLVELPVTVGDTVYEVQQIRRRIQPMEIISAYIGRMGELYFYWELKDGEGIYGNVKGFGLSQLGKTVFLTRAEAEAAITASGKKGE